MDLPDSYRSLLLFSVAKYRADILWLHCLSNEHEAVHLSARVYSGIIVVRHSNLDLWECSSERLISERLVSHFSCLNCRGRGVRDQAWGCCLTRQLRSIYRNIVCYFTLLSFLRRTLGGQNSCRTSILARNPHRKRHPLREIINRKITCYKSSSCKKRRILLINLFRFK